MREDPKKLRVHERWAHFRFSVIGPLLAAPAAKGELQQQLKSLAARKWRHPISGEWTSFGVSTIERWYYKALRAQKDPVNALKRKIRCDNGKHPAIAPRVAELLRSQYRQHPAWSYQLHADNLAVVVEEQVELGPAPSYTSVVRFMKSHGLLKRPRRGPPHSPGAQVAEGRYEGREVRSYESEYVNALWHLDFHHGSRRILLSEGRWVYPILLGVLDDCSRLCCHAQWYLAEGTEELCHGLSQAFQKRHLPRSILFDNGSAMVAKETEEGLARLGIVRENTLPYSPYQNGKQEAFWGQIEGRLMPMLEGLADLTLAQLNEATQAWMEMEYNRKVHSQIAQAPLQRFCNEKDVSRPSPSSEQLQLAFTTEVTRTQRRSDGTISLDGIRYEIPSRYGHLEKLTVRYATWNKAGVYLSDKTTGAILCRIYPLDKKKNAQGYRALREKNTPSQEPVPPTGMAPLMKKIIGQYAATGMPPAYLPKDEINENNQEDPS